MFNAQCGRTNNSQVPGASGDQAGTIFVQEQAFISGMERCEPLDEANSGTHPLPLPYVHQNPLTIEHFGEPGRTSTDNAHLTSHKKFGRRGVSGYKIDRRPVFNAGSTPYMEVVIQRGTTESVAGGLMRITCTEIPMRLKARLTPLESFSRISKEIFKRGGVSGYISSVRYHERIFTM